MVQISAAALLSLAASSAAFAVVPKAYVLLYQHIHKTRYTNMPNAATLLPA